MKIQKHRELEESLTNAYSLFVYAIRSQITRDYYLRRLRTFFDFIKLLPKAKIEDRCNQFAAIAIKDHSWTFNNNIKFSQFQNERLESEIKNSWYQNVVNKDKHQTITQDNQNQ